MSESASGATSADGARPAPRPGATGAEPKRGFFARIALFVRQVVAELKKVVTPTRSELLTYTSVVLVFVAVVMAFVTLIDFGIGWGVFWIFG